MGEEGYNTYKINKNIKEREMKYQVRWIKRSEQNGKEDIYTYSDEKGLEIIAKQEEENLEFFNQIKNLGFGEVAESTKDISVWGIKISEIIRVRVIG